jgi:FRG domain
VAELWRKKVAKRQTKIGNPSPFYCGELSPWFRGVSNSNYDCEPSLFRFHDTAVEFNGIRKPEIQEIEAYFLQRFKTFGTPFLNRIPRYDIEWNFLMRHHLVPSRLLDWSKGSFIALYLATRKSLENLGTESAQSNCAAAVWMLEPRRLSEECHGTRSIFGANKESHREEIERYFSDTSGVIPKYPLPLIPDLVAPRVESHVGRFTLHTLEKGGLTDFVNDVFRDDNLSYLVKIVIPFENHLSISRSLRSTGVSDINFTQDLDGLAKELSLRINLGREDHNRFVSED